jgi:hypothetical protein
MTTDYTHDDLPAYGYRDREKEILPPAPILK